MATVIFGLSKIARHGWVVVEDIPIVTVPLWELVSALLPVCYQPHIVMTKNNQCLYAVKRLS